MKSIKNQLHQRLQPALGLLVVTTMVTASLALPACDTGDEMTESEQRLFTGEELFSGIFLGRGPAADMVPSLQDESGQAMVDGMSDEQWAQIVAVGADSLEDQGLTEIALELRDTPREQLIAQANDRGSDELSELLIAMIAAEDPDFFDDFAEEIQSGDHYRVAAAMGDAAQRLLDTFSTLAGPQLGAAQDQGVCVALFVAGALAISIAGGLFITVGAIINVAVAINVAVVSNVALATETATVGFGEGDRSSLEGEVMIDEITHAFAR